MKHGTVVRKSTVTEFVDYPVKDTWVTGLLVSGKITADTARDCYIKCVSSVAQNLAALDMVLEEQRRQQMKRQMLETEARLSCGLKLMGRHA